MFDGHRARQCLTPALFARAATDGRYLIPRHVAVISEAICDTITGRSEPILLIEAPPRHGKSELVSKFLPAWYLGVWPDRRVMLAAYEATSRDHGDARPGRCSRMLPARFSVASCQTTTTRQTTGAQRQAGGCPRQVWAGR